MDHLEDRGLYGKFGEWPLNDTYECNEATSAVRAQPYMPDVLLRELTGAFYISVLPNLRLA